MDMEEFLKKYYFMYKYRKQKNNLDCNCICLEIYKCDCFIFYKNDYVKVYQGSKLLFQGDFEKFKQACFDNVFGWFDFKIAPVQKIPYGEFVQKKFCSSKYYTRGNYDRSSKKFELQDYYDISRYVNVKSGTLLYYDFVFQL